MLNPWQDQVLLQWSLISQLLNNNFHLNNSNKTIVLIAILINNCIKINIMNLYKHLLVNILLLAIVVALITLSQKWEDTHQQLLLPKFLLYQLISKTLLRKFLVCHQLQSIFSLKIIVSIYFWMNFNTFLIFENE